MIRLRVPNLAQSDLDGAINGHIVRLLAEILDLFGVNYGRTIYMQGLFMREAAIDKVYGKWLPILLIICVILSSLLEVEPPMI